MKDRKMAAMFTLVEMNHRQTHSPDEVNVGLVFEAAMTDGSNVDWSKFTPHGKIEMTVTNPSAIDTMELGQCYRLTFERE